MKFSIKDSFIKCDQVRSFLVTFTEGILNWKLYFLCSVNWFNLVLDSWFQEDGIHGNDGVP